MSAQLKLISHKLCPYVQRAVIALTEKGVAFERIDINLANKPDWFLAISPLGKTPVLQVGEAAIFESAVIMEYLEETAPRPLHPADALTRAAHRGWIDFGSVVLNDIAGFYAAPDEATFKARTSQLKQRFTQLEARVVAAPWFDGGRFSLVDAVYGPVFRYFDVFDEIADFGILSGKPNLARWRKSLAARPSVRAAVGADYPALLHDFLEQRNSWISRLQARAAPASSRSAI
jgi:glutathione S-transferase